MSVALSSLPDISGIPNRSPDRLALKLTFQSSIDLADHTQDSYGTSVSATFCDTALQFRDYVGTPAPNLAWGSLYADNEQMVEPKQLQQGFPEGTDRTLYYAYLTIARPPPPAGQWSHPDHSWDLRADPHDVCVQISTMKTYVLSGTRSNVIRIPAAVLRTAFK